MIQTIEIKDMEGVQRLIFEQKRNMENGRLRSSYFYRGMPDKDFNLVTSLQRNCGELAAALETPILDNFIKYVSIEDPSVRNQFGEL